MKIKVAWIGNNLESGHCIYITNEDGDILSEEELQPIVERLNTAFEAES